MKYKITASIIVLVLSLPAVNAQMGAADGLQIYLPREIAIEDRIIKLGTVSIIRGQKELAESAEGIPLGTFSVSGQKIVIDRPTILSRLASNDIAADKVTLTGAEKIVVRRNQNAITGEELVEAGKLFLQKTGIYLSACECRSMKTPKELVIPADSNEIGFDVRLSKRSTAGQAYVQIDVLSDGKVINKAQLSFQVRYKVQKAVSVEEIEAGKIISSDKIKMVEGLSDKPQPADWKAPYGLAAKCRIPAGKEIEANMVTEKAKEAVISRNQSVLIKVDRPGLVVQAAGKALEKGSAGECIKVQNMESNRVIIAKIKEDGTVEPVF